MPGASLQFRSCRACPEARYFLALPQAVSRNTAVLVTVHGISRNAREHARTFARYCNRLGWAVVAPLFTRSAFARYQQLGFDRDRSRPRPDLALNAILDEVTELTGARTDRHYMFGFSGGGQFVQRYSMVHPGRVAAAALGAPGWYTFPDPDAPFPRGLRIDPTSTGFMLAPEMAQRIPTAVFVGERDVARDDSLNMAPKIDRQQGRTRPERAGRWVAAMREAAGARGLATRYELGILPDCGHSFSECVSVGRLDAKVVEFLISAAMPETVSGPGRGRTAAVYLLG